MLALFEKMIKESYSYDGDFVYRDLECGNYKGKTKIKNLSEKTNDSIPSKDFWQSFLRGSEPVIEEKKSGAIKIIDLFCGCGGFTLGAIEAIEAAGLSAKVFAAVDVDQEALDIYTDNFAPRYSLCKNANSMVDFQVLGAGREAKFSYKPEIMDQKIEKFIGRTNLIIAGPPCQGHSTFNNYTRGADPRNTLYLGVVATAIALKADGVIIENVARVVNDEKSVMQTARTLLENSDYEVTDGTLNASDFRCAQTRPRHFLIAKAKLPFKIKDLKKYFPDSNMTVEWAIGDLLNAEDDKDPFNSTSNISYENIKRIDYLFDNDLYDLPDQERPDCHKNGHTYPSVYGRMRWDEPSLTITTGFESPGRGRFIHPKKRRAITPHEAARIQGFPDFYKFTSKGSAVSKRKLLSKCIGEAVPPQLGYAVTLCWLAGKTE